MKTIAELILFLAKLAGLKAAVKPAGRKVAPIPAPEPSKPELP